MIRERQPGRWALGALAIAFAPAALALVLTGGSTERAARGAAAPVAGLDGAAIAADVSHIRHLTFSDVPPVRAISAREERRLSSGAAAKAREGNAGHAEEAQRLQRQAQAGIAWARLVGFVDPGFRLKSAGSALGSAVVGEYRPSQHRILIASSPLNPPHYDDVIAAHELDHALDAEHFPKAFDVDPLAGGEETTARQSLIEGTATVVTDRFAREHDYPVVGPGRSLYSVDNLGFGVPAGLAAEFRFPYTAGADFVRYLVRTGGWSLVDQAFRHPPTTTAEILDPARWVRRAGSEPVHIKASLPRSWKLVGRTDTGAMDAQVLLSLGLPLDRARAATAGSTGGEIASWRRAHSGDCALPCRGDVAGVAAYRWSSPVAAARFVGELPAYLETRLEAQPAHALAWRVDNGFTAIDQRANGTALAAAPTASLARSLAADGARSANEPK